MRISPRIILPSAVVCLGGQALGQSEPLATGAAGAEFGLLDWDRPTSGPRDTGVTPEPSDKTEAAETEKAIKDKGDIGSRLGVELAIGYASQYIFRGLLKEDEDLIVKGYFDFTIDLHETEHFTLGAYGGVWTSVHSNTESASPTSNLKSFYELDAYGGLSGEFGRFVIDAGYTAYMSPSDAFDTVEEVSVALSFDDRDDPLLGFFAISPYALVAFEIDGAFDGYEEGVYLEVGAEPSFKLGGEGDPLSKVTLSFPVAAGFSLDDYYEYSGEDDAFGFFSAGCTATYKLPVDPSWGQMKLKAGVKVLTLGDNAAKKNDDDSTEVVFSLRLSIAH